MSGEEGAFAFILVQPTPDFGIISVKSFKNRHLVEIGMSHLTRRLPSFALPLTAAALFAMAGCAGDSKKAAAGESRPSTTTVAASKAPPAAAPAKAAEPDLSKPGSYAVIGGEKAAPPSIPMGDPATLARILDEGKNHNQVMKHLTHLTTKIGPRLTGSTNLETANNWTRDQFASWGLSNAQLWKWGEIPVRFDRGPSTGKVVVARDPDRTEFRTLRDMEFTTLAWAAGTNGPVRGPVVKMPDTDEEFAAVESKLKGAWVLIKGNQPGGRRGVMGATGSINGRQRLFADIRKKWAGKADAEKPAEAAAPAAPAMAPFPQDGVSGYYTGNATGGRVGGEGFPFMAEIRLGENNAVTGNFGFPGYRTGPIKDGTRNPETGEIKFTWEGTGGSTPYTLTVKNGTLTGQSVPAEGEPIKLSAKTGEPEKPAERPQAASTLYERVLAAGPAGFISASSDERVRTSSIGGWRELNYDNLPQDVEVVVRQSDYDFMNSRLADGVAIDAEFDLPHTFTKGPIPVYNTIAEIKGTVWPDEVVIVSAHLDSWNGPGSQGTTDNGTGSSVTLEAARILMAAGAKPKRTIRFVLWSGEEQGLLGSREYVKHLKDTGELDKVSAVFVDDGGTNYEGGLQCIESQVPYLAAATALVNGQFYSETDKKFLDVNVQASRRMGGGISGGSSDHASFLAAGVPGFFWDEVGRADYGYGWHTQHDKIDLAIPEYLIQSSTCAAITAYNLACAPAMLPRPEPKATNEEGGEGQRRRRDREQPATTTPQPAGAGSGR